MHDRLTFDKISFTLGLLLYYNAALFIEKNDFILHFS